MVGFYHDPEIHISKNCMNEDMEKDLDFVLNLIFGHENLFHFIEAIRFTEKSALLLQQIFDNCGYKVMIKDYTEFCNIDEDRCKAP